MTAPIPNSSTIQNASHIADGFFSSRKPSNTIEDKIIFLFKALGSIFLGLSLVVGIFFSSWPIALQITTLGTGLLFLGFYDQIFSLMPKKVEVYALYIKSFVTDLLLVLPIGLLYIKKCNRFERLGKDKKTVVFIHGFLGHHSNNLYLQRAFEACGYNTISLHLGHPYKSIDTYTELARKQILKIIEKTGNSEIDIIGHSMGGVIARELRESAHRDGFQIRSIITIASPLTGSGTSSSVGKVLKSQALFDMTRDSDFIKRAESRGMTRATTRHLHICAEHDLLVPMDSTSDPTVPHEQKEHFTVKGVGHLRVIACGAIKDKCLSFINH